MATAKAARVWRRTLVGGCLAAVVAALFYATSRSADGAPIAFVATLLVGGACWELARMWPGRDLAWTLPGAASAALFLAFDFVAQAAAYRAGGDPASYVSEVLFVALFAALSHGVLELLARGGYVSALARLSGLALVVLTARIVSAWFYDVGGGGRDVLLVLCAGGAAFGLAQVPRERRDAALACALAAAWVVLPPFWLWHVWLRYGLAGLGALVVLSKVGDVAGYYAGNAFGRHHPFKRLSPGKTVEGCLASLLGTCAAGLGLGALGWLPGDAGSTVLAAGVVNVAAQAGDLLESWVKRRAGVKDSGTLLGPSGGVLDVIDSLLLTVPTAVLTWPLLLTAGGTGSGV